MLLRERPGRCSPVPRLSGASRLAFWAFWLAGMAGSVRAAGAGRGLDPAKALTQYGLDAWTTEQGLPNATVTAIHQDSAGYLWLGTYDGLARFDGVRFTVFNPSNTPALSTSGIRALCQDRSGDLWVGTNGGGLVRFSAQGWTRYTTADGLPADIVWALQADATDGVWIGTNGGGLARYRDERFETYPVQESGAVVFSLAQDPDGSLWVGTQGDGLRRLAPDGRWSVFSVRDGLPAALLTGLVRDPDGSLWAGTAGGGVARVRAGRVEGAPAAMAGLSEANVTSLLVDRHDTLWIGTNGAGLARYAAGAVSRLTTADGLPGDVVYALHEDADGSLWVGTNGGGLARLRDGSFTTFSEREGLSRDFVYTAFEDAAGQLWAGTASGLDRWDGARWLPAPTPVVRRAYGVRSLTEGLDGALWVGSYGAGVWRRDARGWTTYSVRDGLASDNVRALLVDREGRVWAATVGGLSVFEAGRWRSYRAADGLPKDSLIGLAEDRDGGLWVGTDGGGLCRFRDGRCDVFSVGEGLPVGPVLTLYLDGDGVLWVGTNGGVSRFREGRFETFTTADGLPADSVIQIVDDGLGALWLGTSRGVSRVPKVAFDARAAGRADRLDIVTFDRLDGMRSSQCTGPARPAGLRTRDGRLWFATNRGLAVVDPARLWQDDGPPPVAVVETVEVDGALLPGKDRIVVPAGASRVELRYTAPGLWAPRRVRFRFRMEDLDADWVAGHESRLAEYTALPPGDHDFQVAAGREHGAWGPPATVSVHVEPRFYQTRTFVLLAGLGVLALVAGAHRLRTRSLKARQRDLTALVEERTARLAEELTERERAEAELRRHTVHLASLHETALAVMDRLELSTLLEALVTRAAALLRAPNGFLYLERPDETALQCRVWIGSRPLDPVVGPNEGAIGRAWQSGEAVAVEDYDAWEGRSPQVEPGVFGAMAAVPLRLGGHVAGALGVAHGAGVTRRIAEAELAVLVSFAQLASLALENARLFEALQKSERGYRDLFEQSLALMCTHDLTGRLRSVNPAAAASLGRVREDMIGRDLKDFVPPKLHARFDEYLAAIARDGAAEGSLSILSAAGEVRVWRYRNVLREQPSGTREVIGFAQDVTEEAHAQRALAESEERFRQLAENIDAVFFMRSVDPPRILYVSPAYEIVWGRPRAPLYESTDALLDTLHPDDRPALAAAVRSGATGYEMEYRVIRPDGSTRWIHTRAFPVRDEGGQTPRIAGISEDVTERKQVESLREDLTHTLVHDLKNPLAAIMGSLEVLESSVASTLGASKRELLDTASRNAGRLLALVETILDVSRLEAGAMPISPGPVACHELVGEIFDLVRPLAERKRLVLTNEVLESTPDAQADRVLVGRVVQNLVDNAIKFTPAGGSIRVLGRVDESEHGLICLGVRDSGLGIPEDIRERLFEKFAAGRQTGRGTGLGLLFCRLAVEAHGGWIWAESPPEGGATIWFTLPRASPGRGN